MIRIGITERGDAGLDFTWIDPVLRREVDGVVLITKNLNASFMKEVLKLYKTFKNIIVHVGCTGYGGSLVEPYVPRFQDQLRYLDDFIRKGFPASNLVLRVDPIIPTPDALSQTGLVLDNFVKMNTGIRRVRVSVLDEYRHVKERLRSKGYSSYYEGFQPSYEMLSNVVILLKRYKDLQFELCAESRLFEMCKSSDVQNVKYQGCISQEDLEIFGLSSEGMQSNMQNRSGCLCLSCKTELLSRKSQCPHQCIYCYWKWKKSFGE